MTILFSNPPWWEGKESRGFFKRKRWRRGVRAGSRWPFTYQGRCSPDNPRARDYIPYPFFMGYAATYIGNKIGNEKVLFRDSIALSESYKSYFSYSLISFFVYISNFVAIIRYEIHQIIITLLLDKIIIEKRSNKL